MLLRTKNNLKLIVLRVIKTPCLCGFLFGGILPQAHSYETPPNAQDTVVKETIDLVSPPAKLFIWNNVFGGSSTTECMWMDCENKDFMNVLMCYSSTDSRNGACPTKIFWWPFADRPLPKDLTLRFTHSNGQTKDLKITSIRADTTTLSWISGGRLTPNGFNTSILASELKKLPLTGIWRAELKMQIRAWDKCGDDDNGCPGIHRVDWNAHITLDVVDTSNQQIYLPAFSTSTPVINLNLNSRPGSGSGNNISGSSSLDMCLYDGNDSTSNRISLLLQDEGGTATGRPDGQFSIYRKGGDQSKASDRLDYQVSVINPTTGAVQDISNGKEIIWSDTNRRNIQRPVVLPGGGAPALCVPAPLTLTTPAFSMADKTAGDYTGKLRIIYTPTTQQ
ncbi:CfaE/CblD family pilus tip adhesin [Serratia fonticola]|jgi:hypothetical protein|uniref:CfaE/CblD family pilus tip adhesin n=2 Tax=Serratia fonticola TaxID=47917 RepID=UPI003AAF3DE8